MLLETALRALRVPGPITEGREEEIDRMMLALQGGDTEVLPELLRQLHRRGILDSYRPLVEWFMTSSDGTANVWNNALREVQEATRWFALHRMLDNNAARQVARVRGVSYRLNVAAMDLLATSREARALAVKNADNLRHNHHAMLQDRLHTPEIAEMVLDILQAGVPKDIADDYRTMIRNLVDGGDNQEVIQTLAKHPYYPQIARPARDILPEEIRSVIEHVEDALSLLRSPFVKPGKLRPVPGFVPGESGDFATLDNYRVDTFDASDEKLDLSGTLAGSVRAANGFIYLLLNIIGDDDLKDILTTAARIRSLGTRTQSGIRVELIQYTEAQINNGIDRLTDRVEGIAHDFLQALRFAVEEAKLLSDD